MADDRLLAYLADEMTAAERQAFEAELAVKPELQSALRDWQALAQARQLEHNDQHADARDAAFLRELARAANVPAAATAPLWQRVWQWLWPTPASPMLPVGWALAILMSVVVLQTPQENLDSPSTTRGAGETCARLVVDLPDTLTAKQLRETLAQYAVTLVSGPDEDGRFVLTAKRQSSLQDAARALGATATISLKAGACPKP